tara:strand:+ start:1873 stop:2733 length:861 start_codon:yes stop_codon:yes gene_type:complete
MKNIKYFFQFIIIIIFFIFFKILGPNISSTISGKIFEFVGPFFRSKKLIHSNIRKAFSNTSFYNLNKITKMMWNNYGRVFAEYVFIKDFRKGKLESKIDVEGKEILEEIIRCKSQVIFVSGHLSNFELMALYLEKNGIKLSAIYRPLNNIYLNKIMEGIRVKYICRHQIKKGIGGMKKLINLKKKNFSTALMIDQRVSEGILSNFFNYKAFTTTIPAQLVRKFDIPVVPVYIERIKGINFKITIQQPIKFSKDENVKSITDKLNTIIEKMIMKKPENWIWSHNRWK